MGVRVNCPWDTDLFALLARLSSSRLSVAPGGKTRWLDVAQKDHQGYASTDHQNIPVSIFSFFSHSLHPTRHHLMFLLTNASVLANPNKQMKSLQGQQLWWQWICLWRRVCAIMIWFMVGGGGTLRQMLAHGQNKHTLLTLPSEGRWSAGRWGLACNSNHFPSHLYSLEA